MRLWTRWEKACFDAGFDAFERGDDAATCPYPVPVDGADRSRELWIWGYTIAFNSYVREH